MNYCHICRVDVIGTYKRCPLCKNIIEMKENSNSLFPKIPTVYEKYKTVFNWLLFASIIVAIVSSITNLLITPNVLWFTFVLLGIASSWIISYLAINRGKNLVKQIFVQSILITILVVLWDLGTGWHKWSIDYVLPMIYSIGLVSTFIIGKIINVRAHNIILYLIFNIIFGFIPLVFLVIGYLNVIIPSLICILVTQTALVILIIFEGQKIVNELKRRLHM